MIWANFTGDLARHSKFSVRIKCLKLNTAQCECNGNAFTIQHMEIQSAYRWLDKNLLVSPILDTVWMWRFAVPLMFCSLCISSISPMSLWWPGGYSIYLYLYAISHPHCCYRNLPCHAPFYAKPSIIEHWTMCTPNIVTDQWIRSGNSRWWNGYYQCYNKHSS